MSRRTGSLASVVRPERLEMRMQALRERVVLVSVEWGVPEGVEVSNQGRMLSH